MCFPKPKMPDVITKEITKEIEQPAPTETSPDVQEAVQKERELARRRKGRQSTILAGFTPGLLNSGQRTTLGGA